MSWQLTSFLILLGVLLAGFAWYERSRPPTQVVALVAALAALAVAGRVALGAFPNVKPLTTDVVVFAGYALGGAPGFAVGALAAVVSNFWFGQGPWTPWQMAGWGLCGVLGAVLALGVRDAGRLSLAAACGLAAVAYGALLNFSLMATYGGDLSWRRFGLLEGRAIPFEVAHAAGNVALALVAGPAMVRMLTRFRERFEWERGGEEARPGTPSSGQGHSSSGPGNPLAGPEKPSSSRRMRPALRGGGLGAVLLVALLAGAVVASPARASGVGSAAAWLESVQNEDGGFGASPGDGSGAEMTCWAMLGLEAAGRNPLDVANAGITPVGFLRGHLDGVSSPGDLARTVLALEGAGVDPRDFGGRNLVSDLLASRRQDGSYHGWPNSTAFAVIALRAAGVQGVQKSLDWLREAQNEDGGWGDTPASPSTADGTGAVLQALSADSKASQRGLAYLRRAQQPGGGFSLGGGGPINTQSTAWAIQGILAAGADPRSFRSGGFTAPEYLAKNQRGDGSYRYAKPGGQVPSEVAEQTPVWVTGEVLVAAAGKHFPLSPPPRKPRPKANPAPGAPAPSTGVPPGFGAAPPAGAPPALPEALDGGGSAPGPVAPPGLKPFGAQPKGGSAGGSVPLGPTPTIPETPPAEASGEQAAKTTHSSGTPGAILLGLLAGCVLFGLGLVGRRGWMRWRYGL